MRNRLLRTAICFTLIFTLVFCEASIGFAANEAVTGNGEPAAVSEADEIEKSYEGWDVKEVVYKGHAFGAGDSYGYTGKAITPELIKLSVDITYEKSDDGTVEVVNREITDFSGVKISYRDNVAMGTGYVKAVVEGKAIEIPFSIVFGGITSIKATPSYNAIRLDWNKVAGASGYVVYRSTKSGSGYKVLKTITSGSTASYSNTKLKLGKTYYYKVRPFRTINGNRSYGDYSAVIKQKVQPSTVVITSVSRSSYNSLKIKWKKVSGATGYRIYRSTSPNGTYKKIATVRGSKKVSYTNKKLTCGKTYYYKVRAYKRSGVKNHFGYYSEYKAGRTTPASTKFNNKTMSWSTSVTLRWNKSAGASGYEIFRSTDAKTGYVLVNNITSGKTVKWTNSGLNNSTIYYYKIRPFKSIGGTKVYGSFSKVYTKGLVPAKIETLMKKYEGKPYKWGGNTPKGWDCSGFVQWAINYLFGKKIPRTGGAQAKGGKYVNKNKMSTWQPGDVLIYKRNGGGVSHVGLYLGGGKMMHALNRRYDTIIQDVSYYEKWDRGNYLAGVRRYQ